MAQKFLNLHPDKVHGLVLLSSKAKTNLPADIEWKFRNLLPVLEVFGK